MSDPAAVDRFGNKLARIRNGVTAAAAAFEARWTLAALARADAELHGKLTRQIALWNAATRGDSTHDLERHGQGLVRGYQRAAEVMALSGEADDAFYVGNDPASGLCIAIGHHMASATHAQEAFPGAIFLTPDEIASLLGRIMGIDQVVAVKRAFPGATVTDISDKAAS